MNQQQALNADDDDEHLRAMSMASSARSTSDGDKYNLSQYTPVSLNSSEYVRYDKQKTLSKAEQSRLAKAIGDDVKLLAKKINEGDKKGKPMDNKDKDKQLDAMLEQIYAID